MTIVFTNGVFDIIHSGHVKLLEYAKGLGHHLIVGINSDWSTRRLKGNTRPIFNEQQRKEILLGIRFVDEVRIFPEDTPEKLIAEIRPNILVKGPEARNAIIPGAEFVKLLGGKVITPDWEVSESTTSIIQRTLLSATYPIPLSLNVEIEGHKDAKLHEMSLRFVDQPDGHRPVLYWNGKRVINHWTANIQHNQPQDKHGVSG